MTEWKKVKLGDIAEYVSEKISVDFLEKDSYISTENMMPNKNGITLCASIPEAFNVSKYSKTDVLVSNIRPYFKKIWYATKDGGCSNDVIIFRVKDKNITDSKYLYYLLSQDSFFDYMMAGANGTKMPRGNKKLIPNFETINFDFATQQKIAGVLSSYDDLIENNRTQIKLLEEAAQKLYKEWFVKLNFPGHENTKITDGVPEGWKKGCLRDFGEIITGKTPSTKNENFYGEDIPFVKIPDMHNGIYPIVTEQYLSFFGAESQKVKYIPENSLIVSCIGTAGLVNIAYNKCQTNQQINSIIFNQKSNVYYLYFYIKSKKEYLNALGSNGATMVNVNKEKFANIEVLIPADEILFLYAKYCKPFFDKIKTLQNQIQLLQSARDKLLPRLMKGEIVV